MSSITKYRVLRGSLALLFLLALHPVVVDAQLPDHLRLELLRAQYLERDFDQRQNDFRLWKLQERRRVPVYNAHLNGAVVSFHNHILKDEHYLATNCKICRDYIREIKSYSKKLEQAMK